MTMTAKGVDQNNQAMRPQTLIPLSTFERKLFEVVAMATGIDHHDSVELWRRVEQASNADGYPASSMGLGVQSSETDSSTETAALADDVDDAVLEAMVEACAEMSEVHGLMRRIVRRLTFAKAAGESHRGRQAEGSDCLACTEFASGAPDDRLRSGFCNACFTAWCRFRAGRDEEQGALRREFIAQRRDDLRERN